ncbi:MAG: hemerythrin domain-containing protein [Rikenellaceae bacterium]
MYKVGKYIASDSMSDLICNNYPMLLVMSRFGIDLGFGEESIEEVCAKSGVDLETFLAVVNVLIANNKKSFKVESNKISLASLIQYLHNSHTYFLEYRLPAIRRKLVESLDRNDDASIVIVNYYDEYLAEVHKHMMYEEETLFPYITSIIRGSKNKAYNIDIFSRHHNKVEAKLSEFKNIIIKYYPAKTTNALNNVLYDIFSCERDLASHNDIEDYLLVPTMKVVESQNN